MKVKKFHLNQQGHSLDLPLLLVVVALIIFGLVIVYDASLVQALQDYGDSNYYIKAQLIWTLLGAIITFFLTFFDYHNLAKFANLIMVFAAGLLLAVFIPGLGSAAGGAHRWLNLGFGTLQPAEVLKISTVIWLSSKFAKKIELQPVVLISIFTVVVLGLLQKDLGSTMVFVATVLSLYIISGGSLWQIFATIPVALIGFVVLIVTSSYRRSRVLAFLDPFSDPQGYTYHILQVLIALGSGGITGLGIGQSRQKFYIPEVTTDSIFAIVGEELGFLGSLFLIGLFIALVIRGFKIAARAEDQFGKILASGLTLWLGIQAIVNLGSMVSLFPLTGVPLPFISYGGSALLANMAAIGILLNISRKG